MNELDSIDTISIAQSFALGNVVPQTLSASLIAKVLMNCHIFQQNGPKQAHIIQHDAVSSMLPCPLLPHTICQVGHEACVAVSAMLFSLG